MFRLLAEITSLIKLIGSVQYNPGISPTTRPGYCANFRSDETPHEDLDRRQFRPFSRPTDEPGHRKQVGGVWIS